MFETRHVQSTGCIRTMARAVGLASTSLGMLVATAGAQAPTPTITLARPQVEFPDGFSSIRGFRELSDGRVIVSDQRENRVVLVNLARGTGTNIGRKGQGPDEFNINLELHAMAGDTTYLTDIERRFLVITPGGGTAGTVRFPAGASSSPLAIDRAGRAYFPPLFISTNGAAADSAPMVRIDLRSGKADTLFYRQPAPRRDPAAPINPYGPRDLWVVAPDGCIARVSVDDYRVTWYEPDGRVVQGAPIPYEKVPVVARDKEEHRQLLRRNPGVGTARVSMSGTAPPPLKEEWPSHKPPFVGNAVLAAPSGELWVQRTVPAGEKKPLYDVIDRAGRLTRRIILPPDTKVIGFGAKSVYLARFDDVDLMYLQRYAMP
jgi:hypothetical protein